MVNNTELYDLLDINSNASSSEIKKAYYKQAMKCHPDKNPGHEELFKKISNAYKILSDQEKRENYDIYGLFDNDDAAVSLFTSFFKDFEFEDDEKSPNVNIEIEVNYLDLYEHKTINYVFDRKVICNQCNGEKYKNPDLNQICDECWGRGKKTKINNFNFGGFGASEVICDKCNGIGKFIAQDNICERCKGSGFIIELENYEIKLDPLMDMEVVYTGNAHEEKDLMAGNLIFKIKIKNDPRYEKNKLDLLIKDKVPLVNAISGDTIEITHLNGKKIKLNPNQIIKPNSVWKIPNLGFKSGDQTGDLYLELDLNLQNFELLEQKYEEIKKILNRNINADYNMIPINPNQ
jgi:DnaJ homolog subfamily A member 2